MLTIRMAATGIVVIRKSVKDFCRTKDIYGFLMDVS